MKELRWGETPFDHMSREELIDHSKTMLMALRAANNALHMLSHFTVEKNPYWSTGGTGGRALNFSKEALRRLDEPYQNSEDGPEGGYRTYFRYAEHIHFPDDCDPDRIWHTNERGELIGGRPPPDNDVFKGPWRVMTRDDLKPLSDPVEPQ